MVKELGDKAAQGRTYGNLGNTYYLLGHFRKAVTSHEQVRRSSRSCLCSTLGAQPLTCQPVPPRSACSSPRNLATVRRRDGRTATWGTRTSSWGNLKWPQNTTSKCQCQREARRRRESLPCGLKAARVVPDRKTLQLARQLKDRAVEAQACYSLGNTYTLLQDYERAIDYHLKHLIIAQDLNDRSALRPRQFGSSLASTA